MRPTLVRGDTDAPCLFRKNRINNYQKTSVHFGVPSFASQPLFLSWRGGALWTLLDRLCPQKRPFSSINQKLSWKHLDLSAETHFFWAWHSYEPVFPEISNFFCSKQKDYSRASPVPDTRCAYQKFGVYMMPLALDTYLSKHYSGRGVYYHDFRRQVPGMHQFWSDAIIQEQDWNYLFDGDVPSKICLQIDGEHRKISPPIKISSRNIKGVSQGHRRSLDGAKFHHQIDFCVWTSRCKWQAHRIVWIAYIKYL